MTSNAKKLVKGSFLSGISFVLRIFVSLFMTPFMIMHMGNKSYGLWILVASFSGFYGLLDLGLTRAVQRFLSRSVGREDPDEANRVFNSSLIVFSAIGLVVFLCVLLVAFFGFLFVHSVADLIIFRWAVILMGFSIAIGFPMRSFFGIFSSNLRYDIPIYIEVGIMILKTALFVVALKAGFGIIALSAINLFTDLIWYFSNAIFALKIVPYLRISIQYFSLTHLKEMSHYSLFSFISQIATKIRFDVDTIVISAFIGLEAVAIYSIGIRLVGYFMQVLFSSVGLITLMFSRYEGQGNFDLIKEKFFFTTKISVFISVFVGSLLLIVGRKFILTWVGPDFEFSYKILVILTVPMIFALAQMPIGQLLYGISKHKILAFINIAEAILNLVLSLVFVHRWGMAGVAFGTLIPSLISSLIALPIYLARVLSISLIGYYRFLFVQFAKSVLIMLILSGVFKGLIAVSYLSIILVICAIGILYWPCIVFFGFTPDERSIIFKAVLPAQRDKKGMGAC